MGALTEREIFSCLSENFRLAAESCDELARVPAKGPVYLKLREQLKLIEGACRQAAYWRGDSRWLRVGLLMAEAHKRAGGWLRGIKDSKTGRTIKVAPGHLHPLFVMLGDNLRQARASAERLRTAATGRVGLILPPGYEVQGPRNRVGSGLILPAGQA